MHPSVVAFVAAALLATGCSKAPPAPEPVRAVRVQTVGADRVATTQEYAAEIRARTESRLAFRVSGKVVRRLVDLGAAVHAGQPLAQLDPQDLRLGQDAARAALSGAQVNFEQAQADQRRYTELREQGFISSAELERRDTTLEAARAQLEQARAQAGVQGNQAAYATLVADAAGVVTGVDVEPGMVVAAGTPILRLARDGPRDAVFAVPEDQLTRLRAAAARPGALTVRLWGGDGTPVAATLREVAASADPATRTFLAKADIGRAEAHLGQTASVALNIDGPNAIKLPLAAVFEQQGRSTVWLLDRDSMMVRAQPVLVGSAEGNSVVITEGLAPGAVVVTAGVHVLAPGQRVRLYREPGAAAASAPAPGVALR
jgi:RND family efflux transporter MFP subunit